MGVFTTIVARRLRTSQLRRLYSIQLRSVAARVHRRQCLPLVYGVTVRTRPSIDRRILRCGIGPPPNRPPGRPHQVASGPEHSGIQTCSRSEGARSATGAEGTLAGDPAQIRFRRHDVMVTSCHPNLSGRLQTLTPAARCERLQTKHPRMTALRRPTQQFRLTAYPGHRGFVSSRWPTLHRHHPELVQRPGLTRHARCTMSTCNPATMIGGASSLSASSRSITAQSWRVHP